MAENFFFYDFVKVTGILPALLVFRPKVQYLHPQNKKKIKGRVLIISNHNSFIDPIIIMTSLAYRRILFVATQDLFESKLGNWFFKHVHCIPVNKENFSMTTFTQVSDNLKNDRAVAIFPEGRVDTQTHEVHPFKEGAVLIAMKNDCPILPVYIARKDRGRRRVIVGDLIYPNRIATDVKGFERMKKVSEYLYEKELELERFYKSSEN